MRQDIPILPLRRRLRRLGLWTNNLRSSIDIRKLRQPLVESVAKEAGRPVWPVWRLVATRNLSYDRRRRRPPSRSSRGRFGETGAESERRNAFDRAKVGKHDGSVNDQRGGPGDGACTEEASKVGSYERGTVRPEPRDADRSTRGESRERAGRTKPTRNRRSGTDTPEEAMARDGSTNANRTGTTAAEGAIAGSRPREPAAGPPRAPETSAGERTAREGATKPKRRGEVETGFVGSRPTDREGNENAQRQGISAGRPGVRRPEDFAEAEKTRRRREGPASRGANGANRLGLGPTGRAGRRRRTTRLRKRRGREREREATRQIAPAPNGRRRQDWDRGQDVSPGRETERITTRWCRRRQFRTLEGTTEPEAGRRTTGTGSRGGAGNGKAPRRKTERISAARCPRRRESRAIAREGMRAGFRKRPRRSEASDARIQTTLEGEQENREERERREPTTPQASAKDDRQTNQQEPRNLLPD